MKTLFRLTILTAALTVCAAGFLVAGSPAAGKVLVLLNERTMEGDVEQVGSAFRVRRQTGEATVPGSQVLKACATMEEAFDFVRARANLSDVEERLRLAQWAHVRGLREQALKEVKAAAAMRPNHAATVRLLGHLELQVATASEPRPNAVPETEEPLAPVDVTNDALCGFSTKVQPVLMNACASCHASGKGGAFKLARTFTDSPTTSRAVQQNLTSVLAQLNLNQPQGSPLLTKAVSAHGSLAQAPLKGRQAPAFKLLEDWVQETVKGNPHLRSQAGLPIPEPKPAREEAEPETSFGATKPTEPKAPLDPFDPSIFNRQMHPDR